VWCECFARVCSAGPGVRVNVTGGAMQDVATVQQMLFELEDHLNCMFCLESWSVLTGRQYLRSIPCL
jgi:hypothetical protein